MNLEFVHLELYVIQAAVDEIQGAHRLLRTLLGAAHGFLGGRLYPRSRKSSHLQINRNDMLVIAMETLHPFRNDCTILHLFKIIETGWQKGLQQRSETYHFSSWSEIHSRKLTLPKKNKKNKFGTC